MLENQTREIFSFFPTNTDQLNQNEGCLHYSKEKRIQWAYTSD